MAGKRKRSGVGAICLAKMKFFHPSAPLHKKNCEAVNNREHFEGLAITGECQFFSVVALKMSAIGMNAPILIFLESHSRLKKSCAITSGR